MLPRSETSAESFSLDERRTLLRIARRALVDTVVHGRIPELPAVGGRLREPGGAFVTLYQRRRLRGCMGRTDRSLPLAETVAQCAVTAALHDPRFRPLRAEEVEAVEIELSLLSELKAVEAAEVVAGTHGVLVVCGGCRGLLLPQVARERGWTAEVLLTEACRKAGLAPEAWRARETVIFAFSAETVSEGAALAGSEQRYSTST